MRTRSPVHRGEVSESRATLMDGPRNLQAFFFVLLTEHQASGSMPQLFPRHQDQRIPRSIGGIPYIRQTRSQRNHPLLLSGWTGFRFGSDGRRPSRGGGPGPAERRTPHSQPREARYESTSRHQTAGVPRVRVGRSGSIPGQPVWVQVPKNRWWPVLPDQLAGVTCTPRPLLVVAGQGTGTRS